MFSFHISCHDLEVCIIILRYALMNNDKWIKQSTCWRKTALFRAYNQRLCIGWNDPFKLIFSVFWRQEKPTWLSKWFHNYLFRRWIYTVTLQQSRHEYVYLLLEKCECVTNADKTPVNTCESHYWLVLLLEFCSKLHFEAALCLSPTSSGYGWWDVQLCKWD